MTLSPRVLKASVLYIKSKIIHNMHSYKSHPWKRHNKWGCLRGDKLTNFTKIKLIKIS